MILIKYDRHGNLYDLESTGDYNFLLGRLLSISKELELNGIMLIDTRVSENLTRMDEFASVENGWECVLVIVNDRIDRLVN